MTDKLILALMDKFNDGSMAELDLNDGTTHIMFKKESADSRNAGGMGLSPDQTAALLGLAGNIAERIAGGIQNGGNQNGGTLIEDNRAGPAVRLGFPVNASGDAQGAPVASKEEPITSPIVATFYASASPDAPPFVNPGTKVKAGDTLCILEAMKMMNHLEAEFDCEILAVEAGSGELVEYGQPLFTVKRL